jgi:hypothetical protein
MDKNVANEVVAIVRKCIRDLNESLCLVRDRGSEDEFVAYRLGFAHVLSEIQDRLTDPIYREHMDLIPQEVDYAPLPGPTLSQIGIEERQ